MGGISPLLTSNNKIHLTSLSIQSNNNCLTSDNTQSDKIVASFSDHLSIDTTLKILSFSHNSFFNTKC